MVLKDRGTSMSVCSTGADIRIVDGVEYRCIVDDDPMIEGYWVGKNGVIWSCWKRGRSSRIVDEFQMQISQCMAKDGVVYATLRSRSRSVGRMVAKAFGLLVDPEDVVIHKDENGFNNHLDNLQVMSVSDAGAVGNVRSGNHKGMDIEWAHGKVKPGTSKRRSVPRYDVVDLLKKGMSNMAVSRELGCSLNTVRRAKEWISGSDSNDEKA